MNKALLAVISVTMIMLSACGNANTGSSVEEPSAVSSASSRTGSNAEQTQSSMPNGEIDYAEIDTSLFDPSKYDGTLYIAGHKYSTPITVGQLKENGIYSDINAGTDHLIDAGYDENGWFSFNPAPTVENTFSYLDVVFYNNSDKDVNIKSDPVDDVQIGQLSFKLDYVNEVYIGVDDLAPNEDGEYELFADELVARLGNPKHKTFVNKDLGLMWYWYVYDDYALAYDLYIDHDFDDRWRVREIWYMLPNQVDEDLR